MFVLDDIQEAPEARAETFKVVAETLSFPGIETLTGCVMPTWISSARTGKRAISAISLKLPGQREDVESCWTSGAAPYPPSQPALPIGRTPEQLETPSTKKRRQADDVPRDNIFAPRVVRSSHHAGIREQNRCKGPGDHAEGKTGPSFAVVG